MTSIFFAGFCASRFLGSVTVSTPFLKLASILSASTLSGTSMLGQSDAPRTGTRNVLSSSPATETGSPYGVRAHASQWGMSPFSHKRTFLDVAKGQQRTRAPSTISSARCSWAIYMTLPRAGRCVAPADMTFFKNAGGRHLDLVTCETVFQQLGKTLSEYDAQCPLLVKPGISFASQPPS